MISLVVSIYNMENYLERSMTALLSQHGSFEILLIDDGSTDKSPQMCDMYALKYPQLVKTIHKENGGLSSARNTGIDNANGDFIIFPDPDDWVEPNYIKRLEELKKDYKSDLICIGHYVDYDTYYIPSNENQSLQIMDNIEAQKHLLVYPSMQGFAWNKLYNLKIIKENNLKFLDDVGTTEDLDFAFRYLNYCEKICFDPSSRLYHYYQRDGAATGIKFSLKQLDSIKTYEKIVKESSDKLLTNEAKAEICNIAINLTWAYKKDRCSNVTVWKNIRDYLHQYLKYYLKSQQYGLSRKTQALLACYMPNIYVLLKNVIRGE